MRKTRTKLRLPSKVVIGMKKVLAIVLSVFMVSSVFVACSKGNDDKKTTTTAPAPITQEAATKTIETQKAVIKESDAINFIRASYTDEELGLADVEKDYSLMVSSSGVDIDGTKYIKVAANVMSKSDVTTEDGKPTYNFEAVGEYYISFDGKTVMMKDMKTGKYKKLENRYDAYKAKGDTAKSEKETTKKDAEKTTK